MACSNELMYCPLSLLYATHFFSSLSFAQVMFLMWPMSMFTPGKVTFLTTPQLLMGLATAWNRP